MADNQQSLADRKKDLLEKIGKKTVLRSTDRVFRDFSVILLEEFRNAAIEHAEKHGETAGHKGAALHNKIAELMNIKRISLDTILRPRSHSLLHYGKLMDFASACSGYVEIGIKDQTVLLKKKEDMPKQVQELITHSFQTFDAPEQEKADRMGVYIASYRDMVSKKSGAKSISTFAHTGFFVRDIPRIRFVPKDATNG